MPLAPGAQEILDQLAPAESLQPANPFATGVQAKEAQVAQWQRESDLNPRLREVYTPMIHQLQAEIDTEIGA